jgi:hypothetical protein
MQFGELFGKDPHHTTSEAKPKQNGRILVDPAAAV